MENEDLIRYDASLCRRDRVGEALGIADEEIDSYAEAFRRAQARMQAWERDETFGFLSLPVKPEAADEALGIVRETPEKVDTFLHLGIGGSSLGPIAIAGALDNSLTPKGETPFRRVIVQENIDPEGFALSIEGLDWERTLVNVVSKSGSTIETLATFTAVLGRMKSRLSAEQIARRVIASTESPTGLLRTLADELGARIVLLPANVGGRFSVLTAVGLLPAAAMGVNPHELLAGAAAMRQSCLSATTPRDGCFLSALIPFLLARRGVNIHVLFPYSDLLRGFALWCRQLLAESLGKRVDRSDRLVEVGQTPIASVGSVDQHSLLQLYMEGPADKFFTFLEVEEFRSDESLEELLHPRLEAEHKRGLTLGKLLQAELMGTAEALADAGRPSAAIRIPELTARSLGQLFYFFELSTAYAAELYDIDAFDQPGVEASKEMTLRYLRGEA